MHLRRSRSLIENTSIEMLKAPLIYGYEGVLSNDPEISGYFSSERGNCLHLHATCILIGSRGVMLLLSLSLGS